MAQETERKEFVHIQSSPYRFQSQVYAPEKGTTTPRFAVEVMTYINGAGLDNVDIYNSGSELLIALRNYIRLKEALGYIHMGKSSEQLTTLLTNLWGSDKWDNSKGKSNK